MLCPFKIINMFYYFEGDRACCRCTGVPLLLSSEITYATHTYNSRRTVVLCGHCYGSWVDVLCGSREPLSAQTCFCSACVTRRKRQKRITTSSVHFLSRDDKYAVMIENTMTWKINRTFHYW